MDPAVDRVSASVRSLWQHHLTLCRLRQRLAKRGRDDGATRQYYPGAIWRVTNVQHRFFKPQVVSPSRRKVAGLVLNINKSAFQFIYIHTARLPGVYALTCSSSDLDQTRPQGAPPTGHSQQSSSYCAVSITFPETRSQSSMANEQDNPTHVRTCHFYHAGCGGYLLSRQHCLQ